MQAEELGLLKFDEDWAKRIEASLPKLMVLLAAATGKDSKYDGTVHLTPSLRFKS
jgi:CRISPR/Cas system CSM-associated protein Csm2 small subunit